MKKPYKAPQSDEEHDILWLRDCVADHDSTSIDGGCPISIAEHCADIADRYAAVVRERNALRGRDDAQSGDANE